MGEAFNAAGQVLGEATGATKAEVLEKLEAAHPDAAEIRIRAAAAETREGLGREIGPSAGHGELKGRLGDMPGASTRPPLSERLTLANVDDAFTYQAWDNEQMAAGNLVRSTLVQAARMMLQTVPECPLRTRALNHLIDARMIANAAITFRGRF